MVCIVAVCLTVLMLCSMKKFMESTARVLEEMNEMQGTLAENKMANNNLKSQNNKLVSSLL